MWNVEQLRRSLREQARAERRDYGNELRVGPFDDIPFGLFAQVSANFTAPADSGATCAWLLVVLAEYDVEVGTYDRDIVREIATALGPDGVQVVAGWVARGARLRNNRPAAG